MAGSDLGSGPGCEPRPTTLTASLSLPTWFCPHYLLPEGQAAPSGHLHCFLLPGTHTCPHTCQATSRLHPLSAQRPPQQLSSWSDMKGRPPTPKPLPLFFLGSDSIFMSRGLSSLECSPHQGRNCPYTPQWWLCPQYPGSQQVLNRENLVSRGRGAGKEAHLPALEGAHLKVNLPTLGNQAGTLGPAAIPWAGSARGASSPSSGHLAAKPERPSVSQSRVGAVSQGRWDPGRLSHPCIFLQESRFNKTFRL